MIIIFYNSSYAKKCLPWSLAPDKKKKLSKSFCFLIKAEQESRANTRRAEDARPPIVGCSPPGVLSPWSQQELPVQWR